MKIIIVVIFAVFLSSCSSHYFGTGAETRVFERSGNSYSARLYSVRDSGVVLYRTSEQLPDSLRLIVAPFNEISFVVVVAENKAFTMVVGSLLGGFAGYLAGGALSMKPREYPPSYDVAISQAPDEYALIGGTIIGTGVGALAGYLVRRNEQILSPQSADDRKTMRGISAYQTEEPKWLMKVK